MRKLIMVLVLVVVGACARANITVSFSNPNTSYVQLAGCTVWVNSWGAVQAVAYMPGLGGTFTLGPEWDGLAQLGCSVGRPDAQPGATISWLTSVGDGDAFMFTNAVYSGGAPVTTGVLLQRQCPNRGVTANHWQGERHVVAGVGMVAALVLFAAVKGFGAA